MSDGPSDLARLGGKCRNLVALMRSGLPVPPGFAITVGMLVAFVDAVGLRKHIERALMIDDPSIGDERAAELMGLFTQADLPSGLRRSILDAYEMLGDRMGVAMPRVAVRSSATTEDLEKASGAGQNLTLLDISGNTESDRGGPPMLVQFVLPKRARISEAARSSSDRRNSSDGRRNSGPSYGSSFRCDVHDRSRFR